MPRKWPVFQTAVETGGSRHLVCPDTKRVSDSVFNTELQIDAAATVRASNAGTPARSVPGNRSTVANWTVRVNAPLTARELDRVRVSIERGRPYGKEKWVGKR